MTEDENEFIQFTNTNRKIAQKYLKLCKSNVQQAIDMYYNDNPDGTLHKATSGGSINKKSSKNVKKNILFEEYGVDGMIDVDGTQKMLADLGIEPNDPVFIAISYYFDSPSMCEFSVDGFNKGCQKFGISSLDTFKKALANIRECMKTDYKKIYVYAFNFAKSPEQKSMNLETALAIWDILVKFKYLEEWKSFLNNHWGKSISKDTWNLFYDFQSGFSEFSKHDFDGKGF